MRKASISESLSFRWHSEMNLLDKDGSLGGGSADSWVTSKTGLLDPSQCSDLPTFSSCQFPASLCKPGYRFVRLSFNELTPNALDQRPLRFQNSFGGEKVEWMFKRLTHAEGYMVNVPANATVNFVVTGNVPVTNISYSGVWSFYDRVSFEIFV